MAETKFEMILEIFFLKINNANVLFGKKTLMWKTSTTNKAIISFEWVYIVNPKEFVIATLDTNNKIFAIYMAIKKQEEILVFFKRQAQI